VKHGGGRWAIGAAWIAIIAGLLALGVWQVERLAWKRSRLAASPVPAPVTATSSDAYRRVRATGEFIPARDSFVQASTVRGPGWWVMTPLRSKDMRIILVNRGYVPKHAAPAPPAGVVSVAGLLRLTEPGGGFLRHNDPAADRWYSRDVAAIAARRGLGAVSPYFIDADASAAASAMDPVGGLTVIHFHNNHLAYAITWFILTVMAAGGFIIWIRAARRGVDADS
jgi:surfeit locus 1 family protein